MSDGRRTNTAERLLQATIRQLSESAPEAITTLGLAEDVGISQSAVYRHFPSLDALLGQAVDQIGQRFVAFTRAAQAELRSVDPRDPVETERHFQRILDHALAEPTLMQTYLRHRRSLGRVGESLRNIDRATVAEIDDHLRRTLAPPGGLPPELGEACSHAAWQILYALHGTLEFHIFGPGGAREASARALTHQVLAIVASRISPP